MKKLFTLILALFLTVPTFADNIGYIDMEQIFSKAKMVQNFEKNIKKKREDYKEFFEKKQAELEKAKNKGKSDKDLEELVLKLEEELRPKQAELAQLEAGFQQNLILSVTSTAEEVAKEYGIDVVLDKRVTFYGGLDLTTLVIEKLNN